MKKILFSISFIAAGLLPQKIQAQIVDKKTAGKDPAFKMKSSTIALGLGYGGSYDYLSSTKTYPSFNYIVDKAAFDNVGPGVIGLGWAVSMSYAEYSYYNMVSASWFNMILGFSATYHLTVLKDANNHFDSYAGVIVGTRYTSHNDPYLGSLNNSASTTNNFYPVYGLFIGAKYNFTRGFGVFAEAGFDYSNFRLGINFNKRNRTSTNK